MDQPDFDIGQIVDETFELNKKNNLLNLVQEEIIPKDVPGVIFKLRRSLYYTHLQCSESSNLRTDFTNNSSWRDSDDDIEIHFWETKSFHDARTLSRKFNEFKLLKKLDSGYGFQNHARFWYLDQPQNNRIRLIFENKIINLSGPICLGPLGDASLAKYYFSQLGGIIANDMSYQKILTSNNALIFEFNNLQSKDNFNQWLENIAESDLEIFNELNENFDEINYLSLKTYFYELSIISKFWNHLTKLIR